MSRPIPGLAAAAAWSALALALAAPAARAVQPSARLAQQPQAYSLASEAVSIRAARDSATLEGWWIPGPKRAPVVVMAGPGQGNRADLLPLARVFHDRGFTVLLFDYRDFGPQGPGDADSLRDVVLASRWVDDAVGALRFAHARADSGSHLFGWGHELGSVVMLAAAARERRLTDGIVIDNPFRDTDTQMRWNGTSVIPDAATRQRLLILPGDEPYSAAGRLRVPVLLVLAGKEESAPPAVGEGLFRLSKSRLDRWLVPDAKRDDLLRAPGYVDRVVQWLQAAARWPVAP